MSLLKKSSKLEISEIVPGIWRARAGARASAAYIIKTSPGAVLVDTGPDVTGASVMQALQRARVGLRSLRAILLTGGDGDAAGGASTLRDRSGARVLCSREEGAKLHPFEPDGYLIAGDVVEKHIEVVPAPSRGRLAFLFRPDRALFTGDAPIESFLELAPELVLPARGPAQRGPNALMASMS